MQRFNRVTLTIAVSGDTPPTEFRIFSAGKIETTKGTFIFDAQAAKSVMSEYQTHGADLMVDYDHASLAALSLDPAQAGKAAGWFGLDVRGGELWAVNVRWTPPAADALANKEWRYMSPAFSTDDEGRVTSLLNVAITNLPATRNLQPLIAASGKDNGMTIEEFLKVCKALDIDPTTSLDDALAKIKGEGGDDAPPSSKDGGPPDSSVAPADAPAAAAPPEEKPEKKEAVAASVLRLMSLTGAKTFEDLVETVSTYRASHLELEVERTKLASERKILESAERRKGCVSLVTQAGRAPATVWANEKSEAPKPYLANMPIAEFRELVADAIKAHGKAPPAPKVPVAAGEVDEHGLTAAEQKVCKETGCDPKVFARLSAKRNAAVKV